MHHSRKTTLPISHSAVANDTIQPLSNHILVENKLRFEKTRYLWCGADWRLSCISFKKTS